MRGGTESRDRVIGEQKEEKMCKRQRKIERGQTGETVSYKAYRDTHHNVIRSRQPESE